MPKGRVPGRHPQKSGGPPALSQSDRADRARGSEECQSSKSQAHPLPAYTTPQVLLSNRFEMLEMEGEMSGEVREGLPRRELRLRW